MCTIQEHVAIYEAISRHDSREAQKLMRKHLEEARVEFEKILISEKETGT
ncbi:MAG TPA: FCD domain-containing protein [Desulfosporosinus sp.]|nr:FCD domain-containing protein [Desulfosporosinus sp.]